MGLFENFPYTNFHELNLMWILEALKEIQTTTEQFVAINSLKYADPIQWNIVQQYEKNTIVIDPLTGTAYISVQPVPSGVALTNTDYWTVVFDLGSFVTRAAKNFTSRWEADTTLTATFSTAAGEWLVWGDTLYVAQVNITAGDSYVVDSNIKRITIEEVKNDIYSIMGDLNDLDTTDKSNLVAAINEIASEVLGKIGDLDDLSTTDKSNLVAAINEVLTTLINTSGDLDDLSTTDKSNLVAAINEVDTNVNSIKTNYHYFEEFGAVGDGVTDDTTAINAGLSSGFTEFKLLANKTYLVSGVLYIVNDNTHITGEENSCIKCADNSYPNMFAVFADNVNVNITNIELDNFTIDGNCQNNIDYGQPDALGNLPKNYGGRVLGLIDFTSDSYVNIHNMLIINAWNGGIWLSDCPFSRVQNNRVKDCRVHGISIRNNVNVSLANPANILVDGNVIENSVVGIEIIFGAYNVVVSNNVISGCSDRVKFPAYAFDGTYPNIYPKDPAFNTVSNPNYITAAQQGDGAGIESTGAYTDPTAPPDTSLSYIGNTISYCEMGARVEELSNDATIIGNILRDNLTAGVFLFSSRKVSIIGNDIVYNPQGILIDNYSGLNVIPTNIAITGNQISGSTYTGLKFNADGIVINANQFNDNPVAIYADQASQNIIISSNMFFDYYGAGNLSGIDCSNFNFGKTRIIGNDFNITTPMVGVQKANMLAFDNNINWKSKSHGVASVTNAVTLTVTVPIDYPYAPDTGEIQLTPLELGLELSITNITNTSFDVVANQVGSFNWAIDFNQN